jgi:cephalosporin hydroxylase
MTPHEKEVLERIESWTSDDALARHAAAFLEASVPAKYPYNFFWLGRPIIQYPQDIVATQELIWAVKPDLIIETGIAHGGSLILSASVLTMIEYAEAIKAGSSLDPSKPKRRVLGVDIDIRAHNRAAIDVHPMSSRIDMVQGSSIDPEIIAEVKARASGFNRIMVFLDSNHTHDHVLAELEAYAQLTSVGSYCIVYDTLIEDMPADHYPDRPWGKGDNPKTAVQKYLETHDEFEIDKHIDTKLLISVATDGFLKRTR